MEELSEDIDTEGRAKLYTEVLLAIFYFPLLCEKIFALCDHSTYPSNPNYRNLHRKNR